MKLGLELLLAAPVSAVIRPPIFQKLETCWRTHQDESLGPVIIDSHSTKFSKVHCLGWAFSLTQVLCQHSFPKDSRNIQVYLAFLQITLCCAVCGSDFFWEELEADTITQGPGFVYILALSHCKISHFTGIILGPGSRMLFIERVKEEDEGLYQCIATNLKGSVESAAYVTVQGKAQHQMGRANLPGLCSARLEGWVYDLELTWRSLKAAIWRKS